jgi:hypothetical protein
MGDGSGMGKGGGIGNCGVGYGCIDKLDTQISHIYFFVYILIFALYVFVKRPFPS